MKRLSWFLTMQTLSIIALLSPELISYIIKEYEPEEIYKWYGKKQN